MHEHGYDEYDDEGAGPSRLARARQAVSTLIGAAIAFALLLALGIWFYRLGVRDAQNVPVIRAAAGPAKERPADPGGLVTPHQDRAAYETVDGGTQGGATAALVRADPPAPKPDDLPMQALAPVPSVQPEPAPLVAAPTGTAESAAIETQAPVPTAPESAAVPDAAVTLSDQVEAALAEAGVVTQPVEPARVPGASSLAPVISPLVRPKPADLRERFAAAQSAPEEEAKALAARAEESKFKVQLMADEDQSVVKATWDRVYAANSDILAGRTLTIPTVTSGGRTLYRLRIGPFRDRREASTVCQALKTRGQDCSVTDGTW